MPKKPAAPITPKKPTAPPAPIMPKKPTAPPVPGQEVDTGDDDSGSEPTSLFGDTSSADDTGDSPPGSTQSQMSASKVSIKEKKNKHSYEVKWS